MIIMHLPFIINLPPSTGGATSYRRGHRAQINQPQHFNSTGAWAAFGQWERSAGATFFPSVFSLLSAPSLTTEGSSIMLDHFVEFVIGGTTELTIGPG